LEEESGRRTDASKNGHDVTEPDAEVPDAVGKIGTAAFFPGTNGTNQNLLSPSELDLTSDAKFMYAFWIKHHIISNPASYCEMYFNFGADVNLTIGVDSGETDAYLYAATQSLTIDLSATPTLTPDALHFICVYYNQTGLYLEADNTAIANDAGSSGEDWPAGYVSMGGVYPNNEVSFIVDECGVWVGADAEEAISRRAELWGGGAGWSPYTSSPSASKSASPSPSSSESPSPSP